MAQKAKQDKTPRKTVKVKFSAYVYNGEDGSVSTSLFKNEKLAEKQGKIDTRGSGIRFVGDVREFELEVDAETGKIVSGVKTKLDRT